MTSPLNKKTIKFWIIFIHVQNTTNVWKNYDIGEIPSGNDMMQIRTQDLRG